MQIKDKVYVVTGAGSGLGEATARTLYAGGAYVAVLDRDEASGEKICKELGSRAKFFQADLGDDAGTEAAVNQSIEWSKSIGKPISGAVNCAGIGFAGKIVGRDNKPFDLEAFKYVIQINLIGTYNVTRLVAAHMCSLSEDETSGERGCIIMVSSAAGREGQTGQTPYSASKGGVNALTLPAARDLARHKIRVLTVAPTLFSTNMGKNTPTKAAAALQKMLEFPNRFGNADEFGHLVKSMIENTYMNGEVIPITGASRLECYTVEVEKAIGIYSLKVLGFGLYVKGKHISYQRAKRTTNPDVSLIKIEGCDTPAEAQFYLGKRVAFVYKAKKEIRGSRIRVIWGKIARTHGNSGLVRARFRNNLPPKTFGASVRVMMYPSTI